MRAIDLWLDQYGDSHTNITNKRLHWICVPVIVWCLLALLWSIPALHVDGIAVSWAAIAVVMALIYYIRLSVWLAAGATLLLGLMLLSLPWVSARSPVPLWRLAVVLFVLAWIGQFVGHHVEGKRPSFFKDVQFLLIGPLWLLAAGFRSLSLRY